MWVLLAEEVSLESLDLQNFIIGMWVHLQNIWTKFVHEGHQTHRSKKSGYTSITKYTHLQVLHIGLKGNFLFYFLDYEAFL